MAIADMSPGHKNTVSTLIKRIEQKPVMDPSGAHHPNQSDIGWILNPGYTGQIRSGIGTPVADKSDYLGGFDGVVYTTHFAFNSSLF
jgi:hypothetical protein